MSIKVTRSKAVQDALGKGGFLAYGYQTGVGIYLSKTRFNDVDNVIMMQTTEGGDELDGVEDVVEAIQDSCSGAVAVTDTFEERSEEKSWREAAKLFRALADGCDDQAGRAKLGQAEGL